MLSHFVLLLSKKKYLFLTMKSRCIHCQEYIDSDKVISLFQLKILLRGFLSVKFSKILLRYCFITCNNFFHYDSFSKTCSDSTSKHWEKLSTPSYRYLLFAELSSTFFVCPQMPGELHPWSNFRIT